MDVLAGMYVYKSLGYVLESRFNAEVVERCVA